MHTFTVAAEPWFSWELEGSKASLLGRGVTTEGFLLDLVVSFKHEGVGDEFGAGDGEALEKKPRMVFWPLAVLAEDEIELGFLDIVEGVFLAGVRESAIFRYCSLFLCCST